ncbi:hypothetical protein LY10_00485 [Planktotalea frisia]|uniref:Uncharacterized protein n=1 Tax=Planktotalea frisia TaxID=696762 RepID=A0A1L9NUS3_9RHOB|nr:hypothetical protein PFRI_28250 [Planktotalea frisia]PZX34854.1 hypothetical protein LY10_00485 [Planktotalea frisia]
MNLSEKEHTKPLFFLLNLSGSVLFLIRQTNTVCGFLVVFNRGEFNAIPLLPQNPNFFMGYDAEIV